MELDLWRRQQRQFVLDPGIVVTLVRRAQHVLGVIFLLACMQAQAVDYLFSENSSSLPPGCAGVNGAYSCGTLVLAAGDTLSITAPTTITIHAAFTVGAGAAINSGSSFPLTIVTGAAVGLGANVTLNANVNGGASITIGAGGNIGGNLKTDIGSVTIGADSLIHGDINVGTGAVLLGAGDTLSGSISITGIGAITIGESSSVGGNMSAVTGAVTIGASASVAGNVSTVTGAITLGATIDVYGNISTVDGAISVGTGGKIGGSISVTGNGAVTVGANSNVGGTISAANGDVSAGAGTVTGTAVGTFECLETGSNKPWSTAARRPLYTKLAGVNFSFDIAALNTDGTPKINYASRNVRVELFEDTTPLGNCADFASNIPVAMQTATFASNAAGRTTSGMFNLGKVYKILRCRVTACADSNCGSVSGTPACSTDQFSVRPAALTLGTNATAAPPSAASTPVFKAGANFTLGASSNVTSNYAGLLTLDKSKLTAQAPGQDANQDPTGAVGTLTPLQLTANATPTNATYDEVGYLYLAAGAYRDDAFTAVDSATGDCITDTSGDNNLGDTADGNGRYGCSIGNKVKKTLGRFSPDHFDTAIIVASKPRFPLLFAAPCPSPLTCATAGMAYSRQPFGLTVTARSVAGTTTANYSAAFVHGATLAAWDAPGSVAVQNPQAAPGCSSLTDLTVTPPAPFTAGTAPCVTAAAPSVTTFVQGVASLTTLAYSFPFSYPAAPNKLAAPTDIYLRASDADGVTSARGAASVEGGLTVVGARLQLANNYGSELMALPITVMAQYWNGTRFINSSGDNFNSFTSRNVVPGNCRKKLSLSTATVALTTCIPSLAVAAVPASPYNFVNGASLFKLAAPGAGNIGSVDLSIDASGFPWLPSMTGRANFGIYKGGPVISIQER